MSTLSGLGVGSRGGSGSGGLPFPVITAYNDVTRKASGKAAANSTVSVYAGSTLAGTAVAGPDGSWEYTFATSPNGADLSAMTPAVSGKTPTPKDLPTKPLAGPVKLATIGDSLIGYSAYAGSPVATTEKTASTYVYGFLEYIRQMSQIVNIDSWYDTADISLRNLTGSNNGVFGDHMDWVNAGFPGNGIINRLAAVIAKAPQLILLEGGTNTINSGDGAAGTQSAAYVISKLDQGLTMCRMAGIPAIIMCIPPRGDFNATLSQMVRDVNTWIRTQNGRSGLWGILDFYDAFTTGGNPDPQWYMGDVIHIGPKGGLKVAKDFLLPLLQSMITGGSYFNTDISVNNLIPIATAKMQGTTGTKSGSAPTPTGTIATGCSLQSTRNMSVLNGSKLVVSGDTEAQVIDITPADLVAQSYFQGTFTPAPVALPNPAAGKWYRFGIKVEIVGGPALTGIRVPYSLRTISGNVVQASGYLMQSFSGDWGAHNGDANREYWMLSNPIMAPDGVICDRLTWALEFVGPKTAAAFQLKISSPIVREVTDPRL